MVDRSTCVGYYRQNGTRLPARRTLCDKASQHSLRSRGGNNQATGRVLIPLSYQKFMLLKIVLWIFVIVALLFGVYALLSIPAAIMIRIAKGNSFSERNYRGLYVTGWTLIGIALLSVIIGVIMRFAFRNMMPPEVHYSLFENLFQDKGAFLAGLIVLLLARAFQKGYELQLDNNSIL